MTWTRSSISLGLGLVALARAVGAATFLVPADAELAAVTPVIAEVEVMSSSPSPAEGVPSTDYIVLVERLLKGRVGGSSIVVRVPGGVGADGIGLEVHGAPIFREADRALLFLHPRRDGTYGVMHLALGAFNRVPTEIDGAPRLLAVRDLVGVSNAGRTIDATRDWDLFLDWIEGASRSEDPAADYFLALDEGAPGIGSLGAHQHGTPPLAWDRASRPRRVRWRWPESGLPGKRVLRKALDRWMTALGSPLRLGASAAPSEADTLRAPNGHNDVLFGDPDDLLAGAFDCAVGGVVAVTATWFDPAVTFRYRNGPGGVARKSLEAEILLNDGAECLFSGSVGAALAESTIAHELGHAIGLDHSSEPSSVMFPDLRGRAEPTRLDVAGASRLDRLYPQSTPAGPTH